MSLLIAGIVLWVTIHLVPTLAPAIRTAVVERYGIGPFRGIFALVVIGALTLIVLGWQATPEQFVYVLPPWSRTAGFILMIASFVLIGAAHYPTRLRRITHHPMLAGVAVWAVSHLLTNGTTRALVLFGGLGVWALLEMFLISRRDGPYDEPAVPPIRAEIVGILISAVIFAGVLWLHPKFTGVSPLP